MTKTGFKHIIPPTSISAKVNDKFSNDKSKKGKDAAGKKKAKGRRLEARPVLGRRLDNQPACLGETSTLASDIQIRPPKSDPSADALMVAAEQGLMAAELAAQEAAETEGLRGSAYLAFIEDALQPAKKKFEEYKKKLGYLFQVFICAFFCIIQIEGHIDAYLRIDIDLVVNLCMPRQDVAITLQPKFSIVTSAALSAAIFPIAKGEIAAGGTLIGVMVEPTMFIDMKNDFSITGARRSPLTMACAPCPSSALASPR